MKLKNRKIENTPEIRNLRTSLELWEQRERRKRSKIRNIRKEEESTETSDPADSERGGAGMCEKS